MTARRLGADEVGLPRFTPTADRAASVFDLSSHRRAREAIDLGLAIEDVGFNIFVVGEDRSGRMTATRAFLESHVGRRPPAPDWIYLNNFRHPNRPIPFRLPPGVGRDFTRHMAALVPRLREAVHAALGDEGLQARLRAKSGEMDAAVDAAMDALRTEARRVGLDIIQTEKGTMILPIGADGQPVAQESLPPERLRALGEASAAIGEGLRAVAREATRLRGEFDRHVDELRHEAVDSAIGPHIEAMIRDFGGHHGMTRWLIWMRSDIVENIALFRPADDEGHTSVRDAPERRYAVNLLVDHGEDPHPLIVVEPNPTNENLFGRIEYRQVEGALDTDFTMIRAGALHRANGGVLVVRAEAIIEDDGVWTSLKGALRDREIRIEEPHRANTLPIAGAPFPRAIPLELKLVMVAAPRWYYGFLALDPDFQTYVKVKADIDPDMEASEENLAAYAGLIHAMAEAHAKAGCEDAAAIRLLGVAARWSGRRDRLTARFELIEDVVSEAARLAGGEGRMIGEAQIVQALANRRRRNARSEDRIQDAIRDRMIAIATDGAAVGQINALTVRDLGDHEFGAPSRVTARGSVGRHGVINVERDVALGGPIQQKGVMVLQGFLSGKFARRFPLSFNCSITFEQSYGGVEGDSASLAELLAVLSDLAGLPLRQDLAITGSVDQLGNAQPVGGVHHKIEGFFRACVGAGPLTGSQGVVVPKANERNIILRDDVAAAVAAGRFAVYTIDHVDDAIALFMGREAGAAGPDGTYPAESVYGRVAAELARFDRALAERGRGLGPS
ncbi:MAG: hypothetical protein FJX67_03390 [Alphaproteobacteria bacterium]|nr:hypothetical protein [Alphaproteobacteria bacterium]